MKATKISIYSDIKERLEAEREHEKEPLNGIFL
jgi:hypothetical protein